MLEIVSLFFVFCVGLVSVGVMDFSLKKMHAKITGTVSEIKANNSSMNCVSVEYDNSVNTAEVNPDTKTIYANLNDIQSEIKDTTQALYGAVKENYKLLKDVGFDTIDKTYQSLSDFVENSVIASTIYHEVGHLISGASEVGAELYRSVKAEYGELTKDLKLEYAVSLYNLIENGAEKGLDTAEQVYMQLKKTYGDSVVDPIKDLVVAMLDAKDNGAYKSKSNVA